MGSRYPPRNLYDQALRAAEERAFDTIWTALQTRDPFRDFSQDYELKTELKQKLRALVSDGVTDPIELREWALESLSYR